jgi:UDP-glucose:(heptosyl)LPS alpha-1,3-glucosyltransferase
MRFALAIVKLFPWGGLQRDCLRLARALQDRGHEATIFTSSAEGPLPADIAIEILPARTVTNHGRNRRFSDALVRAVRDRYQRIIGFDKLSGLDILYCVDASIAARARDPVCGWLPRYRALLALESASFAEESRTRIIGPSQVLFDEYRHAWGTPVERFTCCRRISTRAAAPAIVNRRHREGCAARSAFPMNSSCLRSACSRM